MIILLLVEKKFNINTVTNTHHLDVKYVIESLQPQQPLETNAGQTYMG